MTSRGASPASRVDRTCDRDDRGQAAVELALALPIVALLLLAAVQLVVIARDQLAVIHAAREGARAGAVSGAAVHDAGAAARAAVSLTPLDVSVDATGGMVSVTVSHANQTDVPLIGALVPDIVLTATARMQNEP